MKNDMKIKKSKIYAQPDGMDIFEAEDFKKNGKVTDEQLRMLDMYNAFSFKSPKANEVVNVKYIGVNNDHILFDGGFKDYVRVENKPNEAKYLVNTKVGDSVDVFIVSVNQTDYMITGGISSLYESRAHENLKSIEEGDSISCFVKELTPAGYNVDIYYDAITLQGFMPNTLAGINKLYNPESILGKKLDVMIESYSKEEGTYIVSRRKYLKSLEAEEIKNLKQGEVYKGNVTGTTDFGVFVEFNECLTGMIHKTNINPEWQDKLSQIQPGFEIEFYIKEIIKDKIILTQVLRETLWDTIKIGQVITGKVKDIKQFGALVMLDHETIGLIHTSELEKSAKKVNVGSDVKVKIIAIDRGVRKIFLTIV